MPAPRTTRRRQLDEPRGRGGRGGGQDGRRRAPRARARAAENRSSMLVGFMWLAGGALFTGITYAAAEPGGTYVIAWGPMLFGLIMFFRSMVGR